MRTTYRVRVGLFLAVVALLAIGRFGSVGVFAQDEQGTPTGAASTVQDPAVPPDTTAPAIDQPADLVVAAADASGAAVDYAVPSATDDVDGPVPVACAPAPGALFPLGATIVTCSAHDAAGNVARVAFSITVTDQTPPVIEQPNNVLIDGADPSGAVVNFPIPAAQDNVDGPVAVGCDWAPGSRFPVGTTVVTCSAHDAAGNVATPVSFTVTVNAAPATEVPTDVPTAVPTTVPTVVPTQGPTEQPTDKPTDTPSSTPPAGPSATASPTEAPSGTPANGPGPSATPSPTGDPASPTAPATSSPSGSPTTSPTTGPTASPTGDPTKAPTTDPGTGPSTGPTTEPTTAPTTAATATPTPKADGATSAPAAASTPSALTVDQALLDSFTIVTDGGPLGVLTSVWGGLDFPISQEFGHTDFSITHHSWYAYGADYGLDGYEHPGIDIGMPAGTPLYSPIDGVVEIAGGVPYYTFYGNGEPGVGELLIQASDGNQVILGHMGRIVVQAGQHVHAGQFVGLSGGENGDHLHLEARERQPLGNYLIVDPRKSFLVPALNAFAARATGSHARLAATTSHAAAAGAAAAPAAANAAGGAALAAPDGRAGAVGDAPTDRYARITIVRVDCAVAADGTGIAACGNTVLAGSEFTVYNPTNHGRTRVTGVDGQASFGPRAGENRITKTVDGNGFAGAYVSCVDQDTGRVLFQGAISDPSVDVQTQPGERIVCTWYNLAH